VEIRRCLQELWQHIQGYSFFVDTVYIEMHAKKRPKGHHVALYKLLKGMFSIQNTQRPDDNRQRSTQSDRQLDTFRSVAVV